MMKMENTTAQKRIIKACRGFVGLYNAYVPAVSMDSIEDIVESPKMHIDDIEYLINMVEPLVWSNVLTDKQQEEYYIVLEDLEDLLVA